MKAARRESTGRRAIRRRAEFECRAFLERGERHVSGTTVDVSTRGVKIRTDETAIVGEPVVLTLCLPDGKTWIDATGRVSRVERGMRVADEGRAIAVELLELDPTDRERLAAATRHLPEPLPGRGIFRLGDRRWV